MANPIGNVSNAQHAAQVNQSVQTAKQETPKKAATPQDTVNISSEGRAASQTPSVQQGQKPAGNTGEGGQ
jgi:hypothetical protein